MKRVIYRTRKLSVNLSALAHPYCEVVQCLYQPGLEPLVSLVLRDGYLLLPGLFQQRNNSGSRPYHAAHLPNDYALVGNLPRPADDSPGSEPPHRHVKVNAGSHCGRGSHRAHQGRRQRPPMAGGSPSSNLSWSFWQPFPQNAARSSLPNSCEVSSCTYVTHLPIPQRSIPLRVWSFDGTRQRVRSSLAAHSCSAYTRD